MSYCRYIKPLIDRFGSLILLLLLLPLIAATATLIRLSLGTPILFKQIRPGKDETLFTIYKFRTMSNKTDAKGHLKPDEERLGATGQIIRSLSLDELPQLLNILKGEMSFIGPRPLLVEYLTLYNEEQKKRHLVKPGITGWAQVNGRNAISWKEKFIYDTYYVEHCSFLLDCKIVFKTLKNLILREGITAEGMATTEKFNGSN